MVKKIIVFTGLSLILSTTALAGGSIFGGHKTRTSNPDGVNSIGIHICGSLNCPDVILKNGDCGTVEHATVKYGVCVCDEGYKADNDKCVPISQENCNETGEKWCSALNQCVNSTDCCTGLTVSECQVCNSDTGEITDKNEGLCTIEKRTNAGYCFNGECLNPCEINPVENCNTCIPESGKSVCTECNDGYNLVDNTCTSSVVKFRALNDEYFECSRNYLVAATAAECAKCDNTNTPREMVTYAGKQYCALTNCPEGQWKGKWQDNDPVCFKCSESNGWISTTAAECSKCDTTSTPRKMVTTSDGAEYCAIASCRDGQFQTSYGACKECSTTTLWNVSSELECARCGDIRKVVTLEDGSTGCAINECSEGEFQDQVGRCQKCSSFGIFSIPPEECAKCGNTRKMVDGKCILATCPEGSFRSTDGVCRECSTEWDVPSTAEECAKCDGTATPRKRFEITIFGTSDHCSLINCPDGYWQSNTGACVPCGSYEGYTPNTENECAKCDNTDTPRKLVGGRCARVTCPDGMYLYNGFSCGYCSSPSAFNTSKENCDKCGSQRTYDTETGKCFLVS